MNAYRAYQIVKRVVSLGVGAWVATNVVNMFMATPSDEETLDDIMNDFDDDEIDNIVEELG